jgi:hypothetical protein
MEKMQQRPIKKTLNVTALALGTIAIVAAASALALDKSLPYRIGRDHYGQYLWVWRFSGVALAVAVPALILGILSRQRVAIGLALFTPVFLGFMGGVHSGPNPQAWCLINLHQIEDEKVQLALSNDLTNGVAVTAEQLSPYLQDRRGSLECAEHGKYTINLIGVEARCSVHGSISEMEAGWKAQMRNTTASGAKSLKHGNRYNTSHK